MLLFCLFERVVSLYR